MPAFLYTLIFGYLTLPYLVIAFQRFDYSKGILHSEWIEFKNFEFFVKSHDALKVTWNTVKLNMLFLIFVTLISLILAILINECRWSLMAKVFQSTYIFPNFVSWVIVSYILYLLLSTDYGIINKALRAMGLEPLNWYTTPEVWTFILVCLRVWKSAGINSVIFLAAITSIDPQLYESAIIDGAKRWQRTYYITLPLLLPTIVVLTLLSLGKIFYGDFAMIYALVGDNGILFETTDVIDTYVFRALRKYGDFGIATAAGLFQSILGFATVYITNKVIKKYYPEGAIF
jgi:putative aldouronate transport system permease protein